MSVDDSIKSGGFVDRGIGDRGYFETWYMSRDWTYYSPLLSDVIQHSRPGPILDVGTGVGYFVECCQRWGLEAEGLEGSADAVQIGLGRYPDLRIRMHPLSRVFPFGEGSFQTVLINQVIEHLEPGVAEQAVRESARVLRKGGMLLILSPSKFNKKEREEDPTHINLYSPSQLAAMVSRSGFERITPINDPLPVLGTGRVARKAVRQIFKLTQWDWLSASANLRAYR